MVPSAHGERSSDPVLHLDRLAKDAQHMGAGDLEAAKPSSVLPGSPTSRLSLALVSSDLIRSTGTKCGMVLARRA